MRKALAAAVLLLCIVPIGGFAQSGNASVGGSVRDNSTSASGLIQTKNNDHRTFQAQVRFAF